MKAKTSAILEMAITNGIKMALSRLEREKFGKESLADQLEHEIWLEIYTWFSFDDEDLEVASPP